MAEKIKQLRQEKGWTQGELAYHAQLKRPYISLLEESRIKKPSAEKLLAIAKAVNVDSDVLFQAAGYVRPVNPPDKTLPAPVDYFKRYYGVDEATARNLRNMVETVLDIRLSTTQH